MISPSSFPSLGVLLALNDANTPYWRPCHDAMDGSSSSWDDVGDGTCSWNEVAYVRPPANDAWTPHDETSHLPRDGTRPGVTQPDR